MSIKSSKKNLLLSKRNIIVAAILVTAILLLLISTNMEQKPDFNSSNAFQFLIDQVNLGPRNSGSKGHTKAKEYLVEKLKAFSDRTIEQNFVYHDKRDSLIKHNGTNIVASFNLQPSTPGRIMLAAHWDTRPFADKEKDTSKIFKPIQGANDGASGVAVLLEIARVLKDNPIDIGVDIILFDLEDIGDNTITYALAPGNPYCIGSEYFANNLGNYKPVYGILLDMVGDKNLVIPKEENSYYSATEIVEKIWNAAKKVNAKAFVDKIGEGVMDDHIHFLNRGIKVVDLIHSPFPDYWHTSEDKIDKCSPKSLKQVGDVLIELLYSE